MRRYLVPVLSAMVLAVAAPSAFATRVIFDPPPYSVPSNAAPTTTDCTQSDGNLNNFTPCNVSQLDTPYSVAFVYCSTLSGLDPSANGWCLFMTNVVKGGDGHGIGLNTFKFQFTVPAGGSLDGTDVLTCGSQPPGFATNNCQEGATATAGATLSLTFFAPVPYNTNFYLITDFISQPDPATVTVSVPEPGALGLFGLGLLAIGMGVAWQRRRQAIRGRQVA